MLSGWAVDSHCQLIVYLVARTTKRISGVAPVNAQKADN